MHTMFKIFVFDDWKIIHKTPHGLLSYICIVHNSKFLNLQSYKYSSIGHPFQTQLGAIGPTLRLVFLAERSNLQKPLNIELVKGKKTPNKLPQISRAKVKLKLILLGSKNAISCLFSLSKQSEMKQLELVSGPITCLIKYMTTNLTALKRLVVVEARFFFVTVATFLSTH